jgi:hypothetical protein
VPAWGAAEAGLLEAGAGWRRVLTACHVLGGGPWYCIRVGLGADLDPSSTRRECT